MGSSKEGGLQHPIGVVTRRTGLSPEVLRAWERRYDAVQPARSQGGQRLYSDSDVARLIRLKRLVDGGRMISQVAGLPDGELEELIQADRPEDLREGRASRGGARGVSGTDTTHLLSRALALVESMEGKGLERLLTHSALMVRPDRLVEELVVPLLTRIGEKWEEGAVSPAQEHVATLAIRRFLEWVLDHAEVEEGAPVLITCTPQGHRHELGALIVAVLALRAGWRPIYLGPDLPGSEIASAARHLEARAVAVSAVHGDGELDLVEELTKLRGLLPPDIRVLAGGEGARPLEARLSRAGVEVVFDASALPPPR